MSAAKRVKPRLSLIKGEKTSAPRLRAGIIEGTCGEDVGPYPPLPVDVQRALDRKINQLADEIRPLMGESIARQIGNHCCYGRNYEELDVELALHLVSNATLDTTLAPLAQSALNSSRSMVVVMFNSAQDALRSIDNELRRFKDKKGGAA